MKGGKMGEWIEDLDLQEIYYSEALNTLYVLDRPLAKFNYSTELTLKEVTGQLASHIFFESDMEFIGYV
jgi:hypothetical protein